MTSLSNEKLNFATDRGSIHVKFKVSQEASSLSCRICEREAEDYGNGDTQTYMDCFSLYSAVALC
jgi:hypothetical protein